MIDRHPDPCAACGETDSALRAVESFTAGARNEAERILTGAFNGCCDVHQALWATDLKRELQAVVSILGAVEAATQHAMARAAAPLVEAA